MNLNRSLRLRVRCDSFRFLDRSPSSAFLSNRIAVSLVFMQERLQKIIAAAGLASRRHAEELIAAGAVMVNGEVVTQLGSKADPERDHIKVNGKLLNPRQRPEKVYLLLNKPRGYLTSLSDPE